MCKFSREKKFLFLRREIECSESNKGNGWRACNKPWTLSKKGIAFCLSIFWYIDSVRSRRTDTSSLFRSIRGGDAKWSAKLPWKSFANTSAHTIHNIWHKTCLNRKKGHRNDSHLIYKIKIQTLITLINSPTAEHCRFKRSAFMASGSPIQSVRMKYFFAYSTQYLINYTTCNQVTVTILQLHYI